MNERPYLNQKSGTIISSLKNAKTYFTMLEEDEPVPFSDLMWLLALLISTVSVFAICLLAYWAK